MRKTFALLSLMLILLLGSCSNPVSLLPTPLPEAAEENAVKAEPKTEIPTETPSNITTQADLSGIVQFSREERYLVKSLWPLETYTPSDMGELISIDMMTFGDYYMMTMSFSSDTPFEELRETLTGYISGEWLEGDGRIYTFDGVAEGKKILSSMEENGAACTIELTFSLDTRYSEAESMVSSHWPEGAIELPEELAEAKPDSLSFLVSEEKSSVSRSWTISGYDDVMDWFSERYSSADNYTFKEDPDLSSQTITFTVSGLEVKIDRTGIFNSIFVNFSAPTKDPVI